jgi:8-oxo-dGTP pyrophosphatase MutT (NUDIX family)/GNAT superfamily N-acetyltransferase
MSDDVTTASGVASGISAGQQRPLTPQGLYSGAAEAARNLKQARGTPQQMLSALKSSPGVKPEELKWSNVDNAFSDRSVISRDELAQHLDRNLPRLAQTTEKKYSQYATPGGLNYRETLLAYQPSKESYADPKSPAAALMGSSYVGPHWNESNVVLHRRMTDRVDNPSVTVPKANTTFKPVYKNEEGNRPALVPAWRTLTPGLTAHKAIDDKKGTFTLSHEPSGLAVKPGLTYWAAQRLAAELGSHTDWSRPGDEIQRFYKDPANKDLNEKRVDAFVEAASPSNPQYGMPDQELLDKLASLGGKRRVIKEGAKKHLLLDELQSDWGKAGRKRGFEGSTPTVMATQVPSGPWVTNTERWTDLGLKTALYEAAKNGHDTLTWAPGDAHANRYPELSHIADRVLYHPESKTFAAYKNNRQILSKAVEPHELGQIIGDGAAKQLLETARNPAGVHDLQTKNVPVGPRAQGMRGYYDDIVPKRLLKIAREHDPDAAITTLKSKDKHINGYPSLPISPKMRESILKRGFAAFKKGGAVEAGEIDTSSPEQSFEAQRHLAHRDFGDENGFADGGGVETPETPSAPSPKFHVGPIHSGVSGRTDHLPMTVHSGSYVLPADIVSAGGEGNTLAGFRVLRRTFGGNPYGQGAGPYGQKGGVYGLPVTYAAGGAAKDNSAAADDLAGIRDKWRKHGVELDAYYSKPLPDVIDLGHLRVQKDQRGTGVGTAVMQDLTSHADQHQSRIALTPSKDLGASSVGRLKEFYKGHGFVENSGRKKDFTLSHSMYRDPKSGFAAGGKVRAAGIIFLSPEKQVLLMRRAGEDHKGEWALPAGGLEKGETPERAARRETQEEAGYEHDGGLSPFMHSDTNGVEFTTYLAHSERFSPKLNSEHDGAMWVSPSEAMRFPLHPGVRAALEKLTARATKASGGSSSGVPIVAAGGEWVISPEQVKRIGNGDIDLGHRVLDEFVKRVRKELIGTLQKLPGPRRD